VRQAGVRVGGRQEATCTNAIGNALMMAYRKNQEFDPKQMAFHHVLVLEIPTPCWTNYDAAFFGVELPKDVPATQQERDYLRRSGICRDISELYHSCMSRDAEAVRQQTE